jgi:squalene-hopene/tetraprenyl-beta-curcumene cyclase
VESKGFGLSITPTSTVEQSSEAQMALALACEHLLSRQDQAGWWKGELQTNVTMDAEDMLLREFLGIRTPAKTERSAAWIRSQQREDGTWSNFHGGPGDLSTTIEGYWALRLAGDSAQAPHMRAAAEFIRSAGGLEGARVFTHVWLALFGLWSWERVPALPPEIVLLPAWVPLNVYDFACWARQTIVALALVIAHRPQRTLPFDLHELHDPRARARGGQAPRRSTSRAGAWLRRLDRAVRIYERHPLRPLRRLAINQAERWIVRRQEADGSWGGIQPPWVYSLMALHLVGYPLEHPVMRRGLEGIERFMVEDCDDAQGIGAPAGRSRRLEACQSPVWDTALAVVALSDAGLSADHPALTRAAEWLLREEVTVRGDWAVARPRLRPGGWAFEFANDNYPDVDDTAEVGLALLRLAPASTPGPSANGSTAYGSARGQDVDTPLRAALWRGVRWVEGMQSTGGGWGAFDAENTKTLVRELPFLDFGEVIDEPSADVSAHVLELLAAVGRANTPVARAGLRWLLDQQEADGSWFGRWGVNHVYGTGAAVPALIAMGVSPREECIRRAVRWLESHQNDDGGWGEDPRSYDDPAWIGRGPSTASQTAWALIALHAAGGPPAAAGAAAMRRGIAWLVATQRADGTWEEPQYTGTGFPSDYYINYHLYRLTFPIMALARCLAGRAEDADPGASERRPLEREA